VKQVAGTLKRPPHGVFALVKVVPDAKSQFRVLFEVIDKVPNELMGVIMQRHKEVQSLIDFPYQIDTEEAKPKAKPQKGKPTGKTATTTRRRY
jgi:hypothetical protein